MRLLVLLCMLAAMDAGSTPTNSVLAPVAAGLNAEQVAVVVNDDDPNSAAVANYYRQARHSPSSCVRNNAR